MSQKENKKKEVDVVTCPNKDQVRVRLNFRGIYLSKYYQIEEWVSAREKRSCGENKI